MFRSKIINSGVQRPDTRKINPRTLDVLVRFWQDIGGYFWEIVGEVFGTCLGGFWKAFGGCC